MAILYIIIGIIVGYVIIINIYKYFTVRSKLQGYIESGDIGMLFLDSVADGIKNGMTESDSVKQWTEDMDDDLKDRLGNGFLKSLSEYFQPKYWPYAARKKYNSL